jgi:type IV pilus assembly protein PilO
VKKEVSLTPVIAVALVIVCAVGYWLLIHPKRAELGRLEGDIKKLEQKVQVATADERRTEPAVKIRVAELFELAKALPDEDDMPGIILELNSVAASSGIEFVSISPQPAVAKGGYRALPIQLQFEGNYYDLTDFLFRLRNLVTVRDGRLEARGRLFALDGIDFHEGPAGFPQIQANLTISAYVYDVAAAAPAAAPPAATGQTTTAASSQAVGGTP